MRFTAELRHELGAVLRSDKSAFERFTADLRAEVEASLSFSQTRQLMEKSPLHAKIPDGILI